MMAQNCIPCQKSKISRHIQSPLGSYKLVSQRFTEIHLDIIGPLPISGNNRYCVTLIDRYSRWAEAVPISDITAVTVAFAVYSNWIARFGVPDFIVTDQGAQFESHLFSELSNLLGFQHRRTTSYNPKCNGMIERWHRTIKSAIMCHNRPDWANILPSILLGLRTSFSEELNSTPAELVYGSTLRVPGQFFDQTSDNKISQNDFVQNLRNHFREIRPTPASRHSNTKTFISKDLASSTHVFLRTDAIRKALEPPYTGPYRVTEKTDKTYTLEINDKLVKVSIDRLKPCHLENTFDVQTETTNPGNRNSNFDNGQSTNKQTPAIQNNKTDSNNKKNSTTKKVTFDLQPKPPTNTKTTHTRTGRCVRTPTRYIQ